MQQQEYKPQKPPQPPGQNAGPSWQQNSLSSPSPTGPTSSQLHLPSHSAYGGLGSLPPLTMLLGSLCGDGSLLSLADGSRGRAWWCHERRVH